MPLNTLFPLSPDDRWLVGVVGTSIGAALAAVYALLRSHAQHWKDGYHAISSELASKNAELISKNKELLDIKNDPLSPAKNIVEQLKESLGAEISKLREAASKLEAEVEKKESRIRELLTEQQLDQNKLAFYQESKEILERKIEAYKEAIGDLVSRRSNASNAIVRLQAAISDDHDSPILMLQRKIGVIDSKTPHWQEQKRQAAQEKELSKARREQAQLAESKARHQKKNQIAKKMEKKIED